MENFNGQPSLRFPANYYCRVAVILGQVGMCGAGNIYVSHQAVTFVGEGDGVYAHGHLQFGAARSETMVKIEGGREGDTFSLYLQGKRYRFGEWKPDSPIFVLMQQLIENVQAVSAYWQ